MTSIIEDHGYDLISIGEPATEWREVVPEQEDEGPKLPDFLVGIVLLGMFAVGWFLPLTVDPKVAYAIGFVVAVAALLMLDDR